MAKTLDAALAVLNGAIGDYLARTDNGLATPMDLYRDGRAISLDRGSFARAYPDATPRVAVFVPGVMCTESIWELDGGGDYGSLLARDCAITPLYVRYNTGRAIADSGASLDSLLGAVLEAYPMAIDEIVLVGYSMGGLVARSACHLASEAGHAWLPLVKRAVYVGTPHVGAPMERVGRIVARVLHAIDDPYTRLIGQIADLRSEGVKDLGDADLRHEDRAGQRARITLRDARHPVPLLPQIQHRLIAGTLAREPWLAELFGDSLVPVRSATHRDAGLAAEHVRIVRGVSHLALAHHEDVYEHLRAFCEEALP